MCCVILSEVACNVYRLYVGGNAVEIKTEADSNDMTECPHDDQPTSGMFF